MDYLQIIHFWDWDFHDINHWAIGVPPRLWKPPVVSVEDFGFGHVSENRFFFRPILCGIFLQASGIDWGNNLTLYALAHHYNREICVLKDNVMNPWLRIEPTFGNPINVVFYAELHYDAVQIR